MAIVKIKPIKTRVDNALNYIANEEKTFDKEYEENRYDVLSAIS